MMLVIMVNVIQPKNAKMTVTPIPMDINGNPSLAKGNLLWMRVSLFICDKPYGTNGVEIVAVIFILSGLVNGDYRLLGKPGLDRMSGGL
jgi:hypothetical protein